MIGIVAGIGALVLGGCAMVKAKKIGATSVRTTGNPYLDQELKNAAIVARIRGRVHSLSRGVPEVIDARGTTANQRRVWNDAMQRHAAYRESR